MKGMIVGRIRECKETREAVSSTHCHQKKDSTPREDVSWAKETVFGTRRRGVGREDERHLRAAGGDPRTRKEAHGANSEWCAGRAGGAQGWAQVHGPDLDIGVTGSSERPGWAVRRFFPSLLPSLPFASLLPPVSLGGTIQGHTVIATEPLTIRIRQWVCKTTYQRSERQGHQRTRGSQIASTRSGERAAASQSSPLIHEVSHAGPPCQRHFRNQRYLIGGHADH